jgi:hypothetical protein
VAVAARRPRLHPRPLRRIAVALSVSADLLLFDDQERGPSDDLRLQFEAASRLDPDERNVVKELCWAA